MRERKENTFKYHRKCVEKKRGNNKFIRASVRERNLHSTIEPFKDVDGTCENTFLSGDDGKLFLGC